MIAFIGRHLGIGAQVVLDKLLRELPEIIVARGGAGERAKHRRPTEPR